MLRMWEFMRWIFLTIHTPPAVAILSMVVFNPHICWGNSIQIWIMIFIHFSAEINSIQTNKYPTIMGWYNPTFQKHYYPHWFHPLPTPPPPQPPSPPAAHLPECLNLQYLLRIHVSEYTYTYSWAATSRTPQWVNLVQTTWSKVDTLKPRSYKVLSQLLYKYNN